MIPKPKASPKKPSGLLVDERVLIFENVDVSRWETLIAVARTLHAARLTLEIEPHNSNRIGINLYAARRENA